MLTSTINARPSSRSTRYDELPRPSSTSGTTVIVPLRHSRNYLNKTSGRGAVSTVDGPSWSAAWGSGPEGSDGGRVADELVDGADQAVFYREQEDLGVVEL